MTGKCPRHFFLSLVCIILFSTRAIADQQILGNAYDQGGGEFLYSEHHYCTQDASQCTVEYRDIFGDLIAQKKLDFSASPFRPALLMKDYRRAIKLEVGFSDRKDLVVDAGFDNFLRSRWNALDKGESVRFPFLVVGYDDPLRVRAKLDDTGSCAAEELCLEISLDSWFLGLLVDPIELAYSREARKLLRYQGPSNIQGENGESLKVIIHYQYNEASFPNGMQRTQDNVVFSF